MSAPRARRAAVTLCGRRIETPPSRCTGTPALRVPRQSTFEAEGELVLDRACALARDRREDRLDPAVKVAAVDVKDAHCYLKAN